MSNEQQQEHVLSHSIMEAQLCLRGNVMPEVERVLRASIQQATRELQQLRAAV
jgi:hypothetical protein